MMPDARPGKAPIHVFVYGTLRRGEANDINRLEPAPVWVGEATVAGRLFDLGRYPGLLLGGETCVSGEVYSITRALEAVLDEIEEVYPQQRDEYFKRSVTVAVRGRPFRCIVYEINGAYLDGHARIPDGDWVHWRARKR